MMKKLLFVVTVLCSFVQDITGTKKDTALVVAQRATIERRVGKSGCKIRFYDADDKKLGTISCGTVVSEEYLTDEGPASCMLRRAIKEKLNVDASNIQNVCKVTVGGGRSAYEERGCVIL